MYKVKKCGHRRSIKTRFIKRKFPWKLRGNWVTNRRWNILVSKCSKHLTNQWMCLGDVFFPPLEENKNV